MQEFKTISPLDIYNKFSLYIKAVIQSFATFKVIIWTLPSTNHINNNSLLMLQSSSWFFFSSFDNREHSDAFPFFFSVKKGNKKWKMHMHTSRWQPAMTMNCLREELFLGIFWKHLTCCWYFENQKATTVSNDNKAFPYNIFFFYRGWPYQMYFLPLHPSHLPKASQQWINRYHTIISGVIKGHS